MIDRMKIVVTVAERLSDLYDAVAAERAGIETQQKDQRVNKRQ